MKRITAVTIATSLGTSPAISAIDAIENNVEELNYETEKRVIDTDSLVEALNSLDGVITATSLNVRSTPDTENSPIGKLYKNDIVTIISQEDNGWYKINYNGQVGYISNSYVEVEGAVTPDYRTTIVSKTGKVVNVSSGDTLNVRSLPSTKGSILYKLNPNTTVKITGEETNGWYRIEHNSKEGFVSGKYIKVVTNNTNTTTKKGKVVNVKSNDVLNVREKSSASSNLLYTLKNGAQVDIIEKLSNGWVKISYNGKVGYVNGKYIEDIKEAAPENQSPSVNTTKYKVTADINLRTSASWSGDIVKVSRKGETLNVISISGIWAKIDLNGREVYAPAQYLSKIGGTTTAPETQNPSTNTTKYKVTADINLRKSASWSGDIVKVSRKGETLNVISISGIWAKVDLNGREVYAPAQYLSKIGETTTAPEVQKPVTKVYIATSDINFRDSNSWSGNIVHVAKKGEAVNVISIDGEWAKVYHNDKELYAPSTHLVEEDKYIPEAPVVPETPVVPEVPSTPEVEKPEQKPTTVEYVTTADVNMRETASWSGEKIKVIKSGEIVHVVEIASDWAKIYSDNQYGYVPSQYVIPKDSNIVVPDETLENVKYTKYNFTLSEYITAQKNANPVSYTEEKLREYINPTNGHKYEFLELDRFREINVDKLNQLLSANNAGVLKNQGQAIYDSSKKYSIDPLYFVAQSIHETGYGKSTLAKGVTITEIADESKPIKDANGNIIGYEMIQLDAPVTVYNLYGIGAKDNLPTMPNRALVLGTTKAYNEGWTTVEKAIEGAAKFVSTNYINSTKYDQNTLYKIRFNPSKTYLWHQYATTPWYARDIAKLMEKFDSVYESGVEFNYDKPKFEDSKTIELLSVKNPIEDESFMARIGKKDIVNETPWVD